MISNLLLTLEAIVRPFSWAIIHSLWQGGVIMVLLFVALNIVRDNVRLRYALSCSAMAGLMACFVTTALILMFSGNQESIAQLNAQPKSNNATVVQPASDQQAQTPLTSQAFPQTISTPPMSTGIFLLWYVGMMILSFYHLAGWFRAHNYTRREISKASPQWETRWTELGNKIGLRRPLQILISSKINMPCVIGAVKPVVLLPLSAFSGLSVQQIELLLTHELIHIRRYDVLINYLQKMFETILFFNPAAWLISRQIRIERELCCDEEVISLSGDNIAYARALTELAGLRCNAPQLAVAAGGRTLIGRINRMLKIETTNRNLSGFGLTTIILMAVIFTAGLGLLGGTAPNAYAQPDKSIAQSFEPDDEDLRGYWEIDKRRGKYQLQIDFDRGGRNVNTFTESQLERILTPTDWGYMIERDAGTFYMVRDDNSGDDIEGEGEMYFKVNPEYIEELKNHGVRLRKSRDELAFMIHNIRLDFVRGLADLGYDNLSKDELLSMHIHDVSPDYISDLEKLGYKYLDTEQLVSMQIHDVTPDYINDLEKSGIHDLDAEQLVSMQIHDVTPDYISDLRESGISDLDAERLVSMQIHNVTTDYISDLEKLGYKNLDTDQLVSMQIHNVEPDFISEFNELGYEDIDADQLVSMRIHDVDPDLVRELKSQGIKRVSLETLVSMQIHNVTPRYLEQLAELGYTNIKPSQLVSMKIHNVTPRFIEQLEELGIIDVDVEDLIAMRIHNVTPRYIKRLRQDGIKVTDPEKLVALKIYGI
ncbi:MAG: M56 family metallopeptidase [candidate division Zixibacteria bacterium]